MQSCVHKRYQLRLSWFVVVLQNNVQKSQCQCLYMIACANPIRCMLTCTLLSLAAVSLCAVSGTTYKVKCSATGTLPPGFTVTLTAEAGAAGCTRSASATSAVSLPGCCGGGGDTAFATIRPKPTDDKPGNGDAVCFDPAYADCSNRWGWRNEFTGQGPQNALIIAGAAVGCKNTNKVVGKMTVSCKNDVATGGARVILGEPDNFGKIPRDNHFYVGCRSWLTYPNATKTVKKSPGCQPPSFSAPKDTVSIANNQGKCQADAGQPGRCGGQARAIWQGAEAFSTADAGMLVPNCDCQNIYWLVHQADGDWYTARNEQGQCV